MENNTISNNEEIKEETKKQYCIFCGAECLEEEMTCPKCGKSLDPKENLLIEFLVDHSKDKFKGDMTDSVVEAIINFIKSHLYGFILTISIVSVLVVNTVANDAYIKKVTNEPGQNTIVLKDNYSNEQLAVKEAVDSYFYYARNVDELENASEELENYMSPIIQIPITSEFTVTSTHDVKEIENIKDAKYVYSIIDPNCVTPPTSVSEKFFNDGHTIAEVVLYETLTIGSEEKEGFFLLTLMEENGKWSVNEAISLAEDPKDAMYIEDYLYLKADEYFAILMREDLSDEDKASMMDRYLLPEKYNYDSTFEINTNEEAYYVTYEVRQLIVQKTSLTSQLEKDGHTIAQGIVMKNTVDENGVTIEKAYTITFANLDGMWYIGEIVENVASK